MKRHIFGIAVLSVVVLFFCACGSTATIYPDKTTFNTVVQTTLNASEDSTTRQATDNIQEQDTKMVTTQEATTALSDLCDVILARGVDEESNEYLLVANEQESYDGVHVQMGIIKNNAWLYELSSTFPFLEYQKFYIYYHGKSLLNPEATLFYYAGNHCFVYVYRDTSMVYNFELDQTYTKDYDANNEHITISPDLDLYGDKVISSVQKLSHDNPWIITDMQYGEMVVLNTNTMEEEIYPFEGQQNCHYYPIVEGRFVGYRDFHLYVFSFDGTKAELLNDQRLHLTNEKQSMVYHDGRLVLKIKNSQSNIWKVTLDENGEIVDSAIA